VVGVSPRMFGFDPKPVHVEYVVDKVAMSRVSPSISVFSCQFQSTDISHSIHSFITALQDPNYG